MHTVGMTVPKNMFGLVRFHCSTFCDNLYTSSIGESTLDSDVIIVASQMLYIPHLKAFVIVYHHSSILLS